MLVDQYKIRVVFLQMGISNTEVNQEFYQLLIEKADDLEKYRSPETLMELAEEVYDALISLS